MPGRRAGSGGGKYNAESAKKAAKGSTVHCTVSNDDGLLLTVQQGWKFALWFLERITLF